MSGPPRLPWRVGRRVPRTIYDCTDRDIGRMDNAGDAQLAVACVNAAHARGSLGLDARVPILSEVAALGAFDVDDVPWLVKDFDVLYSTAENLAGQLALDGHRGAHLADLVRQLERLRPAMDQIQTLKAALRRPT